MAASNVTSRSARPARTADARGSKVRSDGRQTIHTAEWLLWASFFASFRDSMDQNLANFSATKRAMHAQISRKRTICQGRLNSLLLAEHDAERERRHAQAERKWSKITERRCPECNARCPEYRGKCWVCGFAIGRVASPPETASNPTKKSMAKASIWRWFTRWHSEKETGHRKIRAREAYRRFSSHLARDASLSAERFPARSPSTLMSSSRLGQ